MKNQSRFAESMKLALQAASNFALMLQQMAARPAEQRKYHKMSYANGKPINKPAGSKLAGKVGTIGMGIHGNRIAWPAPALMGKANKAARKRFQART